MRTSGTIISAGSETTATLLSGAVYYLLKSPEKLQKLTSEIRDSLPDANKMTFLDLARLPYLNACLQEAMRIYPPVPGVLPRRTLPGGAVISGHFIPEDVGSSLSLPSLLFHSRLTFSRHLSAFTNGALIKRKRTFAIHSNTCPNAGLATNATVATTPLRFSRSRLDLAIALAR